MTASAESENVCKRKDSSPWLRNWPSKHLEDLSAFALQKKVLLNSGVRTIAYIKFQLMQESFYTWLVYKIKTVALRSMVTCLEHKNLYNRKIQVGHA